MIGGAGKAEDANGDVSIEGNSTFSAARRRRAEFKKSDRGGGSAGGSGSGSGSNQLIPSSGNTLIGLEPSAFLLKIKDPKKPIKLVQKGELGNLFPVEDEAEFIEACKARNFTVLSILTLRLSNLKQIKTSWSVTDRTSFRLVLEALKNNEDLALVIDVIRTVGTKPGLWTLDMVNTILPTLNTIFETCKFEG